MGLGATVGDGLRGAFAAGGSGGGILALVLAGFWVFDDDGFDPDAPGVKYEARVPEGRELDEAIVTSLRAGGRWEIFDGAGGLAAAVTSVLVNFGALRAVDAFSNPGSSPLM